MIIKTTNDKTKNKTKILKKWRKTMLNQKMAMGKTRLKNFKKKIHWTYSKIQQHPNL